MSPATLDSYSSSVRGLDRFLASATLGQAAPDLRREHIEAFITEVLAKWTRRLPTTATGAKGAALRALDHALVTIVDRSPICVRTSPARVGRPGGW